MLSTLLIEAPWLAFGVLIAVIVVAPVEGVWLARLTAVGASAFSVLVEVVEAVVPVIGRACDTSDWITNTIGAVLGGVLAAVSVQWARRRVARAG